MCGDVDVNVDRRWDIGFTDYSIKVLASSPAQTVSSNGGWCMYSGSLKYVSLMLFHPSSRGGAGEGA